MKRVMLVVAALLGVVVLSATPAQAVECCGRVANLSSSTASVRAYDNRFASPYRFAAGMCDGGYINVYPNTVTAVYKDYDCIRMYSGSTKVTGVIKVINSFGVVVAETNVGCTSNRVDARVGGDEVGRVYYARKCA